MPSYETCKSCSKLIDLYPPPQAANGMLWNGPTVIDTTVTIDGKRYCEDCGKKQLSGTGVTLVPGYRVESGGRPAVMPRADFPSPELANKTFTVASGVTEVSIAELDDVANGGKSERVKLVETPSESLVAALQDPPVLDYIRNGKQPVVTPVEKDGE